MRLTRYLLRYRGYTREDSNARFVPDPAEEEAKPPVCAPTPCTHFVYIATGRNSTTWRSLGLLVEVEFVDFVVVLVSFGDRRQFVLIKYSTLLSCYSFCCVGCCRISVRIVKRPTQAPMTVALALKRNETRQLPLMGH
ncbi:Neprilysin-4 [Trichinella spiralis]|uniref:Neprilysin-4 n=1 Tax=Trichinella spiralis TaxID=6334 RepID=A0ABR3K4N8_TRISP